MPAAVGGTEPPLAGGDGIDALPDEVLHHILGLLESHEAVRTCVLARRWRHLWKSATGMRVVGDDGAFLGSVGKVLEFVEHLLQLREGSLLHKCELWFCEFGFHESAPLFENDAMRRVNTWFWNAVTHKARELRLDIFGYGECWVQLDDMPLNSEHLTRLVLAGVEVYNSFLNFSSCPVLEYLEFEDCSLKSPLANNISSPSLKHLVITRSSFWDNSRVHISAPNLVSLDMYMIEGYTPVLETMPSLMEGFIDMYVDAGDCSGFTQACDCEFCDNSYDIGDSTGSNNGVLLRGLSEAKNLALISGPRTSIFKRDLRWCPTFSKLRTLLLDEYWCVPDDFRALVCVREHSPVLEKLTLEYLSKQPKREVQIEGGLRPMERSAAMSEHLKIIEVKCDVVDEKIFKIMFFLYAFNICFIFE